MNIIPTTFNATGATYTVVGGSSRAGSTGISAVLLNRGARYLRRAVFQELEKAGFDRIVSVEGPRETWDVEELSVRFPSVKFLGLKKEASIGEQINLAAAETQSERFFVLWNDIRLAQSGGAARIAEKLADRSALCVVPIIENGKYETLPTLKVPAFYRGTIRTIPFPPRVENTPTLYPFDAVGLYDMDRFQKLGGFDPTIRSFHWQLMDFGLRSRLWGETIRCTRAVKLAYEGEIPSENASVDEFYKVFFLKNLAPVFRGDYAHIPMRRFFPYMLRSGVGILEAWKEFAEGRKWVDTNRFRYVCDARMATELWEAPES